MKKLLCPNCNKDISDFLSQSLARQREKVRKYIEEQEGFGETYCLKDDRLFDVIKKDILAFLQNQEKNT